MKIARWSLKGVRLVSVRSVITALLRNDGNSMLEGCRGAKEAHLSQNEWQIVLMVNFSHSAGGLVEVLPIAGSRQWSCAPKIHCNL